MKVLLAGILLAGVMSGNEMPGALVWSDIVTIPGVGSGIGFVLGLSSGGGEVGASTTDTGISSGVSVESFACCSYTVDRDFTVTTAGFFDLQSSVNFSGLGSNCTIGEGLCFPFANLEADLTETVTIVGDGGLGLFLETAGSVTAPVTPTNPTPFVELDLATNGAATGYLGLGNYTLQEVYTLKLGSTDDVPFIGGGMSASLTPIPEPSSLVLLMAATLLLLSARSGLTKREKLRKEALHH